MAKEDRVSAPCDVAAAAPPIVIGIVGGAIMLSLSVLWAASWYAPQSHEVTATYNKDELQLVGRDYVKDMSRMYTQIEDKYNACESKLPEKDRDNHGHIYTAPNDGIVIDTN